METSLSETTSKAASYLAYASRTLDLLRDIRHGQQPDGSFFSLSVPITNNKDEERTADAAIRIRSTFTTSLLLYRLSDVRATFSEDKKILAALETVVDPEIEFLLSQKSPEWTWNYWLRGSAESADFPYPDDLDDTFVALSAITLHRPELLTGEAFMKITQTLIRQEIAPGGPFQTWIFPKDAMPSGDLPDVAVNSNILGFLLLHNIRLPKLEAWLTDSLRSTDFTSPFYPSALQPLCFFSRAAKHLGTQIEKLVAKKIYTAQQNIAASSNRIQYFDPARSGVRYGNVSTVLETAAEIEELCLRAAAERRNRSDNEVSYENSFLQSAQKHLRRHFDYFYLSENVNWAEKAMRILCEKNHREMLLPWHFYADINGLKSIREIPEKDRLMIRRACIVNLAGWIAYRAYDDILDSKTAPTRKMILRNQCCMKMFNELFEESIIRLDRRIARWIRQRMDHAIERECLRGRADVLQEKSLGCAISPIQILLMREGCGTNRDEKVVSTALRFIRHLLTARQIHDDCHDWQEDLENGFVNLAIRDKETTDAHFWNNCFEKSVRNILFHARKARKALDELKDSGALKTTVHLEKHLLSVEHGACFALSEKRRADEFQKHFTDQSIPTAPTCRDL